MKRNVYFPIIGLVILSFLITLLINCSQDYVNGSLPKTVVLNKTVLLDKIKGGWVGKAYGVSFGGPTEFQSQGKIIEGPLVLDPDTGLKWLTWQDDMYVNMALLKAVVDKGLYATPADFAKEFAHGGFKLWHANGQGRQNILEGIPPEKSGHPKYNPHADDIDFQIECDFIGLYCPGLPQTAQNACDRAGHLMNYGDGVYGGYFVTCMYAAAFITDDVDVIVQAGLDCLPAGSGYKRIIQDVVDWYQEYPDDWKAVWQLVEDQYNHDLCPWGVESKFNIQASLNGAYIVMGLLYGRGDLEKTVEISTRCGQDSDCNPANAGGIISTMLGLKNLPEHIQSVMKPYMDAVFEYTSYSINSASDACLKLALQNIEKNGGKIEDDRVTMAVQRFKADGPAEISFPTLEPVARFDVTDARIQWQGDWQDIDQWGESKKESSTQGDYMQLEFTGNVIYMQGDCKYDHGILEYIIDGQTVGRRDMYMPEKWGWANQSTAVWITGLPDGDHTLKVLVTGHKNEKSEGITVSLGKMAVYKGQVAEE